MASFVALCCMFAAVAARAPVYFSPAAIPPVASEVPLQQGLYNYRGPFSLGPGQAANILAADGRPLDTLDVNLDRSAHFMAKALYNASRVLKKRSVTRLAVAPGPVGFSAAVAAGNIGISAPVAVGPTGVAINIATNPIGLLTILAGRTFNTTSPIAAGLIGLSTPLVTGTFAVSAPVVAGPFAVATPIATGSIAASAPVPTLIGISASGTPLVRTF